MVHLPLHSNTVSNYNSAFIYSVAQKNGMAYLQHYVDAITGNSVWDNFSISLNS